MAVQIFLISKCEFVLVQALEDLEEADRLTNLLIERGFEGSVSFLTSGMFFNDVNQWIWLGSSEKLQMHIKYLIK